MNNTTTSDTLVKIHEMVDLQDILNKKTIKVDNWVEGVSFEGMPIDWLRYVKLESAELAESFPVKHWKDIDKEINLLNGKIELVDIWHFLISKFLEIGYSVGMKVEARAYIIASELHNALVTNFSSPFESITHLERLNCTKEFLARLKKFEYDVALFDLSEPTMKDGDFKIETFKSLVITFFELCNLLDLGFKELHKLYIGKNCLNQFRQNNGYKEGTYIKIWDGLEDNVVMESLLTVLDLADVLTYEKLYSQLEERYKFATSEEKLDKEIKQFVEKIFDKK